MPMERLSVDGGSRLCIKKNETEWLKRPETGYHRIRVWITLALQATRYVALTGLTLFGVLTERFYDS